MLIAFDFDGTLSDSEMTVLLAERKGVADEVAAITERAMNDEIGYAESLRQRADLLGGLPEVEVEEAYGRVELHPGAGDLVAALRDAGHHVAILTGGFEAGVEAALERAGVGVDTVSANRLPLAERAGDGERALTGNVEGPLVEGTKDDALTELAATEGFGMDETLAVGDGANDLPMLEVAETAVGYDPTPAVEREVEHVVNDMRELRDFLAHHGFLEEHPDV